MESLSWQRNMPYSLPLIVVAVSTTLIAIYMWKRKEAPGSKMGAFLMLACAEWIFCYSLELAGVSPATKIFWNKAQYVGAVFVPTLWLIFTLHFTGREHWLTRRNSILLCVIPLVTLVLVFTNSHHNLMWSNVTIDFTTPVLSLEKTFGILFWCFLAYTYGLLAVSAYLLLQMLFYSSHLYRWQASALLIGEAIPSAGKLISILGLNPFGYLDLEVAGLVISSLMVAWCIFRLRLLDLVPVARDIIIESMQDAIIVLDAEEHIVDINDAAAQLIGYTASEAIGWRLDQIWPQWQRELELPQNATHERKEIIVGEEPTARTLDVSVSPLLDWRGRLMTRIMVFRDITERKRSEEILRQSQQRQARVLNAVPDMIYEMDLRGNILFANAFAQETIGIRLDESTGLKISDLLEGEDMRQAAAVTSNLLRGKGNLSPSIYMLHTKDGRCIPIEAHARLLETLNGHPVVLGVARDISERYTTEERLRESEQKYRTLFEESKDALYITSPSGNLLEINSAGVELFGFSSKDEILRFNISDLYAEPRNRKRFQETIERDGFVRDYEIVFKRKNGKRVNVLVTATLVRDESGNVVSYRGALRDITEKKQLEQQLFQAQKMESIGTLAGGIAHDFNNILGGILGYASFMKAKIEPGHPFYSYIDTIEKSAVRASELTTKLLAFARGGKYDIKAVDINRIIDETLDIIGRALDKSIDIEVRKEERLPTVEADAGQIEQILINLCLNARDAMPAGGRLILETYVSVLDEDYIGSHLGVKAGAYTTLSVTDTGIGMTEEVKQRIFEPFFTTKDRGKGTGLGLSMVYGVTKNHGGFVSVYTEPGVGSTFKVYLPVSGKPEMKALAASELPEGRNELILVVDDEEAIRALARDSLESYGYRVISAENGVEALNLYREYGNQISAVLLDMVMPKMGGHETFLKLKELNPNVRALLSTGYSQNGKAQEILDSGVRAFIQKPYHLNELLAKLKTVISC